MNYQDKFNFFTPVREFEKGKDKNGNEIYRVGGVISDDSRDDDKESLDYNGFDFSDIDIDSLNILLSTLSDLNLLSSKIVYSNGEPLIGNASIEDIGNSLIPYTSD